MNTHESYVSSETAKLLKQAGFDWECCYCYDAETKDFLDDNEGEFNFNEGDDNDFYSAPTLGIAQRWLREVKCIILLVWHDHRDKFGYSAESKVFDIDLSTEFTGDKETYEEALEAGIKKCLTLILED